MSKLQPYGAGAMIAVTPRMSASNITCIMSSKHDASGPGFDDHTERPEEAPTHSDLTELF